ncbi:UNVERIFIED_CONTAM: hypothetical protein FKN15_023618 [Acipenser sinensis]
MVHKFCYVIGCGDVLVVFTQPFPALPQSAVFCIAGLCDDTLISRYRVISIATCRSPSDVRHGTCAGPDGLLVIIIIVMMIRRDKTTIFTDAKESTTVYELKRIVEGILKRAPEDQRLYKVRRLGGIRSLVSVMKVVSAESVQNRVARALGNLAIDPENSALIHEMAPVDLAFLLDGGVRVPANREAVSAGSEFFRALLSGRFSEARDLESGDPIPIREVSPQSFTPVMHYLHGCCGEKEAPERWGCPQIRALGAPLTGQPFARTPLAHAMTGASRFLLPEFQALLEGMLDLGSGSGDDRCPGVVSVGLGVLPSLYRFSRLHHYPALGRRCLRFLFLGSPSLGEAGSCLAELYRECEAPGRLSQEIEELFPSSKTDEGEKLKEFQAAAGGPNKHREEPGKEKTAPPTATSSSVQTIKPSATSATLELDKLMACLSDFKVQSNPVVTSSRPAAPPPQTSGSLDSMLGLLQSDLSRQGIATTAKGTCAACQKPIVNQVVTALGQTWHQEHFVCSHCQKEIGGSNFFEKEGLPFWFHERDGRQYCQQDFFSMFASRCHGCSKPIQENYISALNVLWHPECFVVTALGQTWHQEHFVCSHCQKEIGGSNFFEKEGLPFCESDYFSLFSPRCGLCSQPILDKMVTALDKNWHPEHFCCVKCGRPFGEEGFHERDGRQYCQQDFFSMFASRCHGCSKPIQENYISALNVLWHPECFVCRVRERHTDRERETHRERHTDIQTETERETHGHTD